MRDYREGDTFGFEGPNGELILDEESARVLNEIRRELRRLGNLHGVAPVVVGEGGDGRRIGLTPAAAPIWARLSGSASPYGFVEVAPVPGGWDDVPNGRAGSQALEANGVPGLDGKVVEMWPGVAGDWRFQFERIRRAVGPLTLNVSTTFCTPNGTLLAGVAVQISGPGGSFSGVTDSLGRISFAGLIAGSYTITGTHPNGIVLTRTVTLNLVPSTTGANLAFVTELAISWNSCTNVGTATIEARDDQGTLGALTVPRGTTPLTLHRAINGQVYLVGTYRGRTVTTPATTIPQPLGGCAAGLPFFYDRQAISITGCSSLPLAGALVTLDHPAGRLGQATTDAQGYAQVEGGIPALGSETITVTASKERYQARTWTYQASGCGNSDPGASINSAAQLAPAPGFACNGWCHAPIPKQLFLTHPQGSLPLPFSDVIGQAGDAVWWACADLAASDISRRPDGVTVTECFTPSDATTVPVGFRLQGATLEIAAWACNRQGFGSSLEDGHTCADFGAGVTSPPSIATVPLTVESCNPFVAHATVTVAPNTLLAQVFGAGTRTFTVSE